MCCIYRHATPPSCDLDVPTLNAQRRQVTDLEALDNMLKLPPYRHKKRRHKPRNGVQLAALARTKGLTKSVTMASTTS